jgi:hypothetical protein
MAEGDTNEFTIEAKLRGPGPGRYALPSSCGQNGHDFTKKMTPSFSFGKRLGDTIVSKVLTPGPVHFVKDEITRFGKDGTPKYTQLGRRKEPNIFKAPGPGRYENHKCFPQGETHAPKYSMSSRTKYRRCDAFPSSNSYCLPPLLGAKNPCKQASYAYSMTSRRRLGSFDSDLARTPGPAKYNMVDQNTYKRHLPKYSLLARRFVPGDKTRKPGPGTHWPEKVTINKKSVPKYSMGVKHSEYITPFI